LPSRIRKTWIEVPRQRAAGPGQRAVCDQLAARLASEPGRVAGPLAFDADQSQGRQRRQRRHRPLPGADRPGHPRRRRAAIISAITLGITVSRHLIKSDELASADPTQVIRLVRPCVHSLAARPDHSGPS